MYAKFSAFMPELEKVPAYFFFCISSIKLLQVK